MTNDVALQAPAGWYPDPADASSLRWWNGSEWTADRTAWRDRYADQGRPATPVPAGTPVYTKWIWLALIVPSIALLPLFGWDVGRYVAESATNPLASLAMMLDPWYLALTALSWVAYGLAVWLAYLDYAELGRLGYASRFHWAWALLSMLVYVIGRSAAVRRQAGRGRAPIAVAVAIMAVTFIAVMTWATVGVVDGMTELIDSMPTSPTGT